MSSGFQISKSLYFIQIFQSVYARYQNIIFQIALYMQSQKGKANKFVNSVTNFTQMRFTPRNLLNPNKHSHSLQIVNKFKDLLPWRPTISSNDSLQSGGPSNMILNQNLDQRSSSDNSRTMFFNQLKYCLRLTMEHIIIGNKNQIDIISINKATRTYLDSDYLWSLSINMPIDLLTSETRKCLIILGNRKEKCLKIYRYEKKKMKKKAQLVGQIIFAAHPQAIFFLKDQLTVAFESKVEFYLITNDNQISKTGQKDFKLKSDMRFFKAPLPIDNTANFFFYEDKKDKNIFTLWLIEVELKPTSIIVKEPQKVYDIKKSLKSKLILKNFSKETFLMNLGAEILAFKKGYIIDSVSISVSTENSILKYIGDERMIHISDRRIEIYEFKLNSSSKPYRIKVSPLDSISIRTPQNGIFLNVLEVYNQNILICFQIDPKLNRKKNGETNYWIALTQPITLEEKIDLLFPKRKFSSMPEQQLEEHCDIARKMGMTNKSIFIQLWNRSSKKEENFRLLLNTRDYKTIRGEIIKLMKKNSLTFSELYKLERSCLQMLKEDVLTSNCTTSIFNGFVSSAFFKKKLEYYRDYSLMNRQKGNEGETLMVSIKLFNYINEIHLQTHFIQLIKELCRQNKSNENQIRIFLSSFKLPLRFIYKELLTQIINLLRQDFIILLEKIPQILPYQLTQQEHSKENYYPPGFFRGIYGKMLGHEEQQNFTLQKIVTIDNKNVIHSVIKDVLFKRSFLTGHSFLSECSNKLQEIFAEIQSENIFYFVISHIVQLGLKSTDRKIIFKYLETKYRDKIVHLKNRINLRYLIYDYFERKRIVLKRQDGSLICFKNFLSLTDDQLFLYLFDIEKNRKGFLLSEIKPIYEENSEEGSSFFNNALLSFFRNPVSQLTDIKYLLNRINNEKQQFHSSHQDMYRILVEAMTYKLIIGADDSIPLSEIIIYIENVPLQKNDQIIEKLKLINNLNNHLDLLNDAKISMSVKQIIEDPNKLMTKLMDYYLIQKQKFNSQSINVLEVSYRTLANLQFLHSTIYRLDEEPPFYIFFIFLTKLIEYPNMIGQAKQLIHDKFLARQFNYDQSIAESLVIYIYKLKMFQSPSFPANQAYLKKLITLLPDHNQIKDFIICEFEYAVMLSSEDYKVEYPLGIQHSTPGLSQLQYVLHKLSPEKILSINIDKLYHLVKRLQQLSQQISDTISTFDNQQKSIIYSSLLKETVSPLITKKQIYEIFILRLLELKKIKECIGYIDQCLSQDQKQSDIILPFIFLSQIGNQLNHESKELFFRASSFYFKQPIKLFSVIKKYVLTPQSIKQKKGYLTQEVLKGQQTNKGFNIQNKLLNQKLIKIAIQEGLQGKLFMNIEKAYHHLTNSRAEFTQFPYCFIYIILVNNPYLLSKFILCSKRYLKIRSFRLILTYLTKDKSFQSLNILEAGYRVFLIVMFMLKQQSSIQDIISQYFMYPLDSDLPETIKCDHVKDFDYFNRLKHSAFAFKKQKQEIKKKLSGRIQSKSEKQQVEEIKRKLLNPSLILGEEPIEYSQVSQQSEQQEHKNVIASKKKKKFNVETEIKKVIMAGKKKKSFESDDREFNVFDQLQSSGSSKQVSSPKRQASIEEPQGIKDSKQFRIRINPKGSQSKLGQSSESDIEQQEEKQSNYSDEYLNLEGSGNSKVKQIIRQSALSHNEDQKSYCLGEKDVEQNISLSEIPERQEKLDYRAFSIDKNHEFSRVSSENNKSEKDVPKDCSPYERPKKKKQKNSGAYPWFDGLPPVEETAQQIYRSNLLVIDNPKNRVFKIKLLSNYQKHPEFDTYLLSIIEYIYKESNSSLNGIIRLIGFLISTFKLKIDPRNLQIWIRVENLSQDYELDFPIRKLFPITTIYPPSTKPEDIFGRIVDKLLLHIDDVNIFKTAKLIGLAFLINQYEIQIIYRYFLYRINKKDQTLQSKEYEKQKMEALIDKMKPEFINSKFEEIYEVLSKNPQKSYIKDILSQKMKKKGKRDEKITFFSALAGKESEYNTVLVSLQRF